MCRIVLFDLDGTLLDTSRLIMSSLVHAVKASGGDVDALTNFTWGRPLRDVLAELCAGQEQLAFTAYQDFYRRNQRMIGLFPGIEAVLEQLRRSGRRLAVVTNKGTKPARRDLRDHDLEQVFEVMVGREEVQYAKPHPEPVLTALQMLDEPVTAAKEAIMLGDTPWDMMAGRAAGTMTGGVLWGPDPEALRACEAADVLFRHPAELKEWLSQ